MITEKHESRNWIKIHNQEEQDLYSEVTLMFYQHILKGAQAAMVSDLSKLKEQYAQDN